MFGGRTLAEAIDVDIRSRSCSFPFFHQVLAAKGTLLFIAWFAASPLLIVFELILLLELLITLLLQLLPLAVISVSFRGKDKGDNRSDDFIRFLLL